MNMMPRSITAQQKRPDDRPGWAKTLGLPKDVFDTRSDGESTPRAPGMLAYKLLGKPLPAQDDDTPVLVFLPGFPDRCESFDGLAARFADTHACVLTCLPDYEQRATDAGGGRLSRRWGHSFDSICDMLRATIERLVPPPPPPAAAASSSTSSSSASSSSTASTSASGAGPRKVTLVVHDWGAFVCYRFVAMHPEMVEAVVALDVAFGADHTPLADALAAPLDTARNLLLIAGYQGWLILAFVVSQLLSGLLADVMVGFYPWKWVGPTPHEYRMPRRTREIHAWMAFPYLQLWSEKLLSFGARPRTADPTAQGAPLLFLYGAKKRAMFHTPAFLRRLDALAAAGAVGAATGMGRGAAAAVAASRWRRVEGAGHWMHTQKPDQVEAEMRDFFAATARLLPEKREK